MLSERISILTSSLHISISDIARAGGCSPSNLSRLRSGSRTPPQTSPTIAYLVKGIVALCKEKGLAEQLSELTSIPISGTNEQGETALKRWLFESNRGLDMPDSAAPSAQLRDPVFGTRLDQLMKLADMSNGELSRRSGLTPSYISRLRRGERIPKYSSKYLDAVCKVLLSEAEKKGKMDELSELTGIQSGLSPEGMVPTLRSWMFDPEFAVSQAAVNGLLMSIRSVDSLSMGEAAGIELSGGMPLIQKTQAEEIRELYIGKDGIRAAVTRFLCEAIGNGSKSLLLYSDSTMDWMDGSFRPLLTSLMLQCIKKGMSISIIHNVDRSMPELTEAIRWWLPLYMTGQVTSYYSSLPAGERFSHTLFIDSGRASISSFHYKSADDSAVFRYSTDAASVSSAEICFDSLLGHSRPLVEISPGAKPERNDIIGEGLRINVSGNLVIIKRTEEPLLSFRISHPLICRAFRYHPDGV